MNHADPGNCGRAPKAFIASHTFVTDVESGQQRYAYAYPATGAVSRIRASAVKSLLAVIVLAFAVSFGAAAPASAANVPCWRALINDWYDGRIDEVYPRHCYSEAIKHLPRDVDTYSSAKDDIERALLDSIRNNLEPTWDPGEGAGGTSAAPGSGGDGSKSIITRAIEWLGPSNADAIPLPLLILAAVAFLLLAAAGGSVLSRKLQERRLPPPNS